MKLKKPKLVFGVGINDSSYPVTQNLTIEGKRVQVWMCPYYRKWKDMLQRCYSESALIKNPTYLNSSVCQEWHLFTNFKAWMEKQDWQGKELDKDILFPGNNVYSPENCVFVSQEVNKFLNERENDRGNLPIGVTFHKSSGKFAAQCWDIELRKQKYLGLFTCPNKCHLTWLEYKIKQCKLLAKKQTDQRVAKALIDYYENFNEVR